MRLDYISLTKITLKYLKLTHLSVFILSWLGIVLLLQFCRV